MPQLPLELEGFSFKAFKDYRARFGPMVPLKPRPAPALLQRAGSAQAGVLGPNVSTPPTPAVLHTDRPTEPILLVLAVLASRQWFLHRRGTAEPCGEARSQSKGP